MSKKKILLIVAIVIAVGGLGYISMTMNTVKITKVNFEEAKKRELIEIVSASGRIQPQTKVDITSEVNGEIIKLLVKEGNQVEAGDLLVVLDTVQLRSDVDRARFAVTEIEARLEGAKITLDQNKELYEIQENLNKDKLNSEIEYTNAKYAYLNAESSYKAMKAQTKQVKSSYDKQLDYLSKAKLVAPMAGIITFLDCEEGEIASAQTAFTQGRTLMTISNLNVFEVEVEVDETEINKVQLGQFADIEVDAFADTVFPGEVVEIGNTALITGVGSQDQSTNFKVKVIFKDSNVKIRPGMSATVDIVSNKIEDALSIPYSSVVMRSFDMDSLEQARAAKDEDTGSIVNEVHAAEADETDVKKIEKKDDVERKELKGVFVIREGVAQFVEINTGIADQKNIEVTSGLVDGDSIISGPYKILRTIKDGDAVEEIEKKKE